MRELFILQGIPATGKSYFIRDYDLERNTLSYDTMREIFSINAHDSGGEEVLSIRKAVQTDAIRTVERAAEYRMSNGETLFIDNTNTSRNSMKPWLALARKYNYTPHVLSFGKGVPVEDIIRRDSLRPGRDRVGEATIRRMADSLSKYEPHPDAVHVYEDHWRYVESIVRVSNLDLNSYSEVVVVGDIQGCGNALEKMVEKIGPLEDKSRHWIFCGDFFDRGPTPEKVLDIMVHARSNVTEIEGNHERSVRHTLMGTREFKSSKETTVDVVPQNRHKSMLKLVSRGIPCTFFEFAGSRYFASHAGVNFGVFDPGYWGFDSEGPWNLAPDYDFYIGGGDRDKAYLNIGTYEGTFMEDLNTSTESSGIAAQFFGHRNPYSSVEEPHSLFPRLYPLENKVEFDGTLVAAVISKDGTIRYEHTTER